MGIGLTDKERRRRLIDGLVGGEYIDLYLNNPTFHASIQTLADMLPWMIDGLAAGAREAEADIKAQIDAMTKATANQLRIDRL